MNPETELERRLRINGYQRKYYETRKDFLKAEDARRYRLLYPNARAYVPRSTWGLSDEVKDQIFKLKNEGISWYKAAPILNVPARRVQAVYRKLDGLI